MSINTTLQTKYKIQNSPKHLTISKWIKLTCLTHTNNANITIIIINEKEMISLNNKFRNKNRQIISTPKNN